MFPYGNITISLLIGLLWSASGVADTLHLNKVSYPLAAGQLLTIHRSSDHSSQQTINDIVALQGDAFVAVDQQVPRFGYTHDSIWAKLDVVNPGGNQKLLIEFEAPIEALHVYVTQDGKVLEEASAGMLLRPDQVSSFQNHSYPVAKIHVPSGNSSIYINQDAVAPHFPVILHSESSLEVKKVKRTSTLYFLYGISITFFVLIAIICLFVERRSAICLLLAFSAFFLLTSFITGLFRTLPVYQEVSSFYIGIQQHWALHYGACSLFLSLFAISHIGPSKFFGTPITKITTISALAGQVLLIIVSLFDVVIAMNTFSAAFNVILLQSIVHSVQNVRKGCKEDLLLAFGWSTFSFFSTMQLMYYLGFFEVTFFAQTGTIIGFFLLVACSTTNLVLKNRIGLITAVADKDRALVDLERNYSELRQREQVIRIFSNPLINIELSLNQNPLAYQPKYLNNSVVFFDMRGFTKLSENHELLEVYEIINLYTACIIEAIQTHRGYVDKIIGDAVMARFDRRQDCLSAVRQAHLALIELNRTRCATGLAPVHFGTGITYGRVLSANFGSPKKLDRTIIGDVVNTASRIEALTRHFNVDILIDEAFFSGIETPDYIRPLGEKQLKGRSKPTRIYEHYSHNIEAVRQVKQRHGEVFQQCWKLSSSKGHSTEAIARLQQLIHRCPAHTIRPDQLMDQTLQPVLQNLRDSVAEVRLNAS